jgi:hypothetical protein
MKEEKKSVYKTHSHHIFSYELMKLDRNNKIIEKIYPIMWEFSKICNYTCVDEAIQEHEQDFYGQNHRLQWLCFPSGLWSSEIHTGHLLG